MDLAVLVTKRICVAVWCSWQFPLPAKFAVIPLQDIFGLGSEARMNMPSTSDGKNWIWRMAENMTSQDVSQWLKQLSLLYGRNVEAFAEVSEE